MSCSWINRRLNRFIDGLEELEDSEKLSSVTLIGLISLLNVGSDANMTQSELKKSLSLSCYLSLVDTYFSFENLETSSQQLEDVSNSSSRKLISSNVT